MVSALVYMIAYWTRPTVTHDVRLSIVVIHQCTTLHGLLTLKGYLACAKINIRL